MTATFISGALAMAYAIVALFFLRFWRRTHDRLFLAFAASFALLAIQRVALVTTTRWVENSAWLYTIRLAAFALLLIAILDKNRVVRD